MPLEDEQVERARLLERLFDGTFDWRSSPDQVQRYCDEIIRVNRGLGDDDGHYSPSKLAMRLRSLVPTATVREEWDDARRDLVQANTLTDPVAVIVAIQNSLVRYQAKQRLAVDRPTIPLGSDGASFSRANAHLSLNAAPKQSPVSSKQARHPPAHPWNTREPPARTEAG